MEPGPAPGGLGIDDYVRQSVQVVGGVRWAARTGENGLVRLGRSIGQHPAAVSSARELRPAGEHRVRHVLRDDARRTGKTADVADQIDDVGRTRREVAEGASCEERFFRLGVNSARQFHGSSRVIGQVIQCGPPPPRTSSPPSNVMAAR